MCDADLEICQGCQNLVITPYDIKKYFCYMSFNQYINDIGEISDAELEKATSYKRSFWETYVLPKYPATFIEKIREDAEANPIDVWDPKRFEGYKS
ncbi:integrase [Halopseudomonas bauzanensis]|uniref:Integrase n=2 Tax=Halopseudomonas bauzanensis TaxID=653930 RepID=A0A4U0YND2_9GAMM|nr:integrase [Halopseudomonas bauzanensis]